MSAKQVKDTAQEIKEHPMEGLLRMDRMPHIWCSTCGLGTTVTALATAINQLGLDTNKMAVVSGIGCTGRVAGYLKLDSFHTTHGRALPFALGLHISRPDMKVIVFSGDGDLISIGGNHFIHTARRNVDITVICVNNFIYAMTGGQVAPTTPVTAKSSTTPYGCYEHPFNLPRLAASSGATYVARWTALHIRRMTNSFKEAIAKPGFSFVEVIAPCSTLYARLNRLGTGLDLMKFYHDNSVIKHGIEPKDADIDFQSKIVVGKFIDIEKPTYIECLNDANKHVFGDKYKPYGGSDGSY
ncbi:MAG: 2-oxoacid:ferredoxin oxidoreductase subunit beta [Candidatus Zixiibacteriota bacterium]|nr:MAG: 2-oxoacid:ferredoxin oxidoreductase subunit beta [candidate division Zixibacteria bacterium]